jgi:hypothetical protein
MRMRNHELSSFVPAEKPAARGLPEVAQNRTGDQGSGIRLMPRQDVGIVGQSEPHGRVADPGADHVGRYTRGGLN